MDFKLLGSILLIVGTSIGDGMLALPIATAQLGFAGSIILLFGCWFVMTAGALLILEVNLWLPQNSNLISMARATIGPVGQMIAWASYILLLYSLLCAYISGGSELFHNLFSASGITSPLWGAAVLFVCVFGIIVYFGIRTVDYVNRGLMFVKLSAYLLLIVLLMPFITLDKLVAGNMHMLTNATAITVTITSFGYAAIVPSLRVYFAGDIRKLKIAIFVGSLIPLVCYIFWDAVIMGVIPINGSNSLMMIMQSQDTTSALVNTLNTTVPESSVNFFVKLFTSICVVTSFLGVSLCLTDFLADGLRLEKAGGSNVLIHLLTFLPPLGIVLFFPNVFINALAYAGVYCVVLLILLPAWMAWQGRYHRHLAKGYRVLGGKPLIIGLILFSLVMSVYGLVG
jgi:tyrosine-specific transport protein